MSKKEKKIYCGLGEVPNGSRLGTVKECLAKNQVRYYGIQKVSQATIDKLEATKFEIRDLSKKRDLLFKKYSGLVGKVNGIKRQYAFAKKEDEKKRLKEEGSKYIKEKNAVVDEYEKIEKQIAKYRKIINDNDENDENDDD